LNRMETWQKGYDDDGSRSISAGQGVTSVVTAEQQRHFRSCTTALVHKKRSQARQWARAMCLTQLLHLQDQMDASGTFCWVRCNQTMVELAKSLTNTPSNEGERQNSGNVR
jgi:hypothetical protein